MTDSTSLIRLVQQIKPDEIYNLAAQSHVKVSFDMPEYTAETDAVGTLRLLEAIRICGLEKTTRIYQASTSELYGNTLNTHHLENLDENSPMNPVSPYAIAKLYAYHMVRHYRDAFGIFAVNGILQNHESSRRGDNFVTKKIVLWAKYKWFVDAKNKECLHIGRLDSSRDWSHAKDMVRGMWMILQQSQPEDYVLGSGVRTTIREFIEKVVNLFNYTVDWKDSSYSQYKNQVY
jgi:GDPmannose 4,6-dehydratase